LHSRPQTRWLLQARMRRGERRWPTPPPLQRACADGVHRQLASAAAVLAVVRCEAGAGARCVVTHALVGALHVAQVARRAGARRLPVLGLALAVGFVHVLRGQVVTTWAPPCGSARTTRARSRAGTRRTQCTRHRRHRSAGRVSPPPRPATHWAQAARACTFAGGHTRAPCRPTEARQLTGGHALRSRHVRRLQAGPNHSGRCVSPAPRPTGHDESHTQP
jgi:hypothetical protein